MLEVNTFSDETLTLHKHRLSKPSFDTLLNKSKRAYLVVLKPHWENNALNTFLGITIGKELWLFPGKVPHPNRGKIFDKIFATSWQKETLQTGAKIFVKIFATSKPSWNLPNWGKIFVKIFAILKPSWNLPNWGKNFCQNFCNLKAQLEHSKLEQFLRDKGGGFTKIARHFNIPSEIILPSGVFFPSGAFSIFGVPGITSGLMNFPNGALTRQRGQPHWNSGSLQHSPVKLYSWGRLWSMSPSSRQICQGNLSLHMDS